MWAEVLGVERVGVTDDFFEIGGDSIRSIQIVARCKRADIHFRPSDVFQHPTVAALALLADATPRPEQVAAPAFDSTYPLSSMQQGMLFHSIAAPSIDLYVQQLSVPLEGPFDAAKFERAWDSVMRRHAVLRTAFSWHGLPEPLQVVAERVGVPLEVLDWRGDEHLAELCAEERRAGFDLSRAPLMRIKALRISGDATQLVWTWHHIILDAWSVPIVIRELLAAYDGAALPPAPAYKDFIAWQRSHDLREAEAFWRAQLADVHEPTPLTVDRPSRDAGYGLEHLRLSDDEAERLRDYARRARVTLNTIAQGAWAILLGRYSGRDEVLFGTTVAGRPPELPGVERMVGLLINTLPLRVAVPPSRRVGEWLDELQRGYAESRRYEHAPLAEVQAWSARGRGAQLFESLLVVENLPVGTGFSLSRDRLKPVPTLRLGKFDFVERANFPLTILLECGGEAAALAAGYDHGRFDRDTIVRLLGHLRTLLADIARSGDEHTLADLHYMTEEECRASSPAPAGRLVRGVRSGRDARDRRRRRPHSVIHRLFEDVARETPDAIAAVFVDDSAVTYRELNARANRFARGLQSRGIRVEDSRGDLRRRVDRAPHRHPRHDEGWRGVRPARSVHSESAARRDDRRLRRLARARRHRRGRCGRRQPFRHRRARESRLHHLHLRLDRPAQGRGRRSIARCCGALVDAQIDAFRIDRRPAACCSSRRSASTPRSEIFTALLAGATLYMAPRQTLPAITPSSSR